MREDEDVSETLRYCICGWSDDDPEAEHRHEERMQAAIVRSADAIAWARLGEQLDRVAERGF